MYNLYIIEIHIDVAMMAHTMKFPFKNADTPCTQYRVYKAKEKGTNEKRQTCSPTSLLALVHHSLWNQPSAKDKHGIDTHRI